MNLPEKLVYLRKQKGLSQEELAEKMALSRQAISRWESGGVSPGTDNLKFLSCLYGVTVDYLIDDTQGVPPEPAPPESLRTENPILTFLRKYGWRTAFFLAMVVILILVGCILNIHSQAENRSVPMQDLPTYVVGADDGSPRALLPLMGSKFKRERG